MLVHLNLMCKGGSRILSLYFVRQDSRIRVAPLTACSALRAIPSLRSALTAFGGYVLLYARLNAAHQLVHPCDGFGGGWQDVAVVEKVVPRQHIEIIP